MPCKLVFELLDLQRLRLGQFNQIFRRYAQFDGSDGKNLGVVSIPVL